MQDVKIIPIFNQLAPNVWADFASICLSTGLTNYGYQMTDKDVRNIIERNRKKWAYGTHFAFGAFANNKMVGFIQGTAQGHCATIQSLYVLHEYQKKKIGRGLLQNAERAVSLFANRIELIALSAAEPFYQAHGYHTQYGTNAYEKNKIDVPRCRCLPVFRCNRALESKIQKLDASFNAAHVNKLHLPMFAYFDVDGKVTGYMTPDRIMVNSVGKTQDIIAASLRSKIVACR